MKYPDSPLFLLDENSSAPAGGPPAPAGGSPAPSSPHGGDVSPPGGAGDAPPSGGHDQFDGMESNDYEDVIDLGEQTETTGDEPGVAAAPPAAVPQGVPPTPPAAVPGPQPAAPVAQPVPPQGAAAPGADAGPPRTQLDHAMEGLKGAANQTALSDWAASNLFKLSEADLAAYETDPGALIPQLMGRVYTNAMQSAVNLIKNLVPEMVNSGITTQQTRSQRASEALNEFYQANPHLSADQHGAAVDRWARAFRAQNPNAPRADAIAFVGKAVSAEFGIWPQSNGSGQPARRAAPFAPARPGGRAPTQQRGPHDPYAGMEQDDFD